MLTPLFLLALLQVAPPAAPVPIDPVEPPVTPVPLTAPACLAVSTQLVRVAESARLLLGARNDAASTDPHAQAMNADWQHRIDAVDQLITNIHVAYPRGAPDESLYPGLRVLPTPALLHEGQRCGVRPAASVAAPTPTPAASATPVAR